MAKYAEKEAPLLERIIMQEGLERSKAEDWARDEITRLREENARLREALEPFAEMQLWTDAYPDGPLSATSEERFVDPLWIVAAREAIREGGKDG